VVTGVDELLVSARRGLARVEAADALEAAWAGALIVDIRPDSHRATEGTIAGALVVDRNVLEWRLDPVGEHRIPELTSTDQVVILVCDEGYASSLAAATLQTIGLSNATDLVGGFRAWKRSGLPVRDETSIAP
jgi:rhodanese-related sulfurtransferase